MIDIEALNYADFVAFIGQVNTPPGSGSTLRWWIDKAKVSEQSHVLDLACTTGFSSREASISTRCSTFGVDISADAICIAKANARERGVESRCEYVTGNAEEIPAADGSFTHVFGGCNFAFIHDRGRALDETRRVLKGEGTLCISGFHYLRPPPAGLVDEVSRQVSFRPDPIWTKEYWDGFFGRLFWKSAERELQLRVFSPQELDAAVRKQIFISDGPLRNADDDTKNRCFRRLLEIRQILNEHRAYQGVSVQTWVRA